MIFGPFCDHNQTQKPLLYFDFMYFTRVLIHSYCGLSTTGKKKVAKGEKPKLNSIKTLPTVHQFEITVVEPNRKIAICLVCH